MPRRLAIKKLGPPALEVRRTWRNEVRFVFNREEIGRLKTTWMATGDQQFQHDLSDGTVLRICLREGWICTTDSRVWPIRRRVVRVERSGQLVDELRMWRPW